MMMINIFGVISECVIITYFLCKYFGFRYHDYAIVKSSLFFLIIAIYDYASGRYIPSEFVAFWGFFLLTFLFSFIFLKGNVLEKIATCALTFILIASINLPILAISSAITNQYPDAILSSNGKTDVLILDTFFSKIIYFGVLQAILLFRRKEKIVLKAKEWIVIIASFIISILIASLVRLLLITHSTQPFFYFFIALCLTALDLIILLFIIVACHAKRKKLTRKTKKNAPEHHVQERFLLPINGVSPLFYPFNFSSILATCRKICLSVSLLLVSFSVSSFGLSVVVVAFFENPFSPAALMIAG